MYQLETENLNEEFINSVYENEFNESKSGTTSTLRRHLFNNHPILFKEKNEGPLDQFIKSNERLIFTQDIWNENLIKWIVEDDQSFNVVEKQSFKTLIKQLRPDVKIPSADTVSSYIFKLFDSEKLKIVEELQNTPGQISFTVDAWTSKNQSGSSKKEEKEGGKDAFKMTRNVS
nr:1285_t:CDS:2 [Entrophospora candida]